MNLRQYKTQKKENAKRVHTSSISCESSNQILLIPVTRSKTLNHLENQPARSTIYTFHNTTFISSVDCSFTKPVDKIKTQL